VPPTTTNHQPPNQQQPSGPPPPIFYPYPTTYTPDPYYPPYASGYYYKPKQPIDILRIIAAIPVVPSYIFLGIIFLINFIFLLIGLGFVIPDFSNKIGTIVMVYPWPNFLYPIELSGGYLLAWYIFIVASIIISIFWLLKSEGTEFVRIFINSVKKVNPPPMKLKNSIVIIFQLFFAVIFFDMLVVFILTITGTLPTGPTVTVQPELWEWFFGLANASVAEEIFTKTIFIGIPLLIFDVIARRPKNKIHRYFIGGGFKIEYVTIILIVFSSVLFGVAHYPSWGLWKVIPTFVSGLAFGYLYVKKGIHTSIILHFLFDYLAMLEIFFINNQQVYIVIAFFIIIIMLFWIVSGSIYFMLSMHKIYEFFAIKLSIAKPVPIGLGPTNIPPQLKHSGDTYYPTYSLYTESYPWKSAEDRAKKTRALDEVAEERVEHYERLRSPSHLTTPVYGEQQKQPGDDYHAPPVAPPPIPRSHRDRYCPTCDSKLEYSQYANSYYCKRCLKYVF
jgi:hypothetical protein